MWFGTHFYCDWENVDTFLLYIFSKKNNANFRFHKNVKCDWLFICFLVVFFLLTLLQIAALGSNGGIRCADVQPSQELCWSLIKRFSVPDQQIKEIILDTHRVGLLNHREDDLTQVLLTLGYTVLGLGVEERIIHDFVVLSNTYGSFTVKMRLANYLNLFS